MEYMQNDHRFFRAFITLRSQFFPISSHSASFNGNRVKKSPQTLDLSFDKRRFGSYVV